MPTQYINELSEILNFEQRKTVFAEDIRKKSLSWTLKMLLHNWEWIKADDCKSTKLTYVRQAKQKKCLKKTHTAKTMLPHAATLPKMHLQHPIEKCFTSSNSGSTDFISYYAGAILDPDFDVLLSYFMNEK